MHGLYSPNRKKPKRIDKNGQNGHLIKWTFDKNGFFIVVRRGLSFWIYG